MPVRSLRERIGDAGEAAAVLHLRQQGFRILAQDWRSRAGQADVIAEEAGTLVLIEVKARTGAGFGLPEEAVDWRKRRRLRQVLESYRLATGRQDQACRIDVVGLRFDQHLAVRRLSHVRDAVHATDP